MRKRGQVSPRETPCAICGAPFITTHSQGKYCSAACVREGERASWRRFGERNKDYRAITGAAYYAANRERELERTKAYKRTAAGKSAAKASDERQVAKHPERIFARQMVCAALRARMLQRLPCRCGASKVQAHHRDYSKPLDVEWLCDPCHRIEHRKVGFVLEDGAIKGAAPAKKAA